MPTPQKVQEFEKAPETVIQAQEVVVQAQEVVSTQTEKFEKMKASLPKNKPINVIALRDGYYRKERKKVGDKFTIENSDKLGTWMKPY